jgi:hypothetical protein
MDHYTVVKTVNQISDVLWSKMSSKHLTVPDHDRFLDIAVKFQERWNFPNVIGCIDGEHFRIKCHTKLAPYSTRSPLLPCMSRHAQSLSADYTVRFTEPHIVLVISFCFLFYLLNAFLI